MAGNSSWGIEVGASAIKAIRLARDADELTVTNYEVLPFKEVLTTPELDVHEAIKVNLDQLISRHDFSKDNVVVSLPGHMAFARFAKMPPVPPKEVPKIVHYEAAQQIPFPIEQVEWDYQVFEQEDSPEVGVGIFAITKDRVAEFLSDYRHVGLDINELTLSPLAVYNAFYYDEGSSDDATTGKVYLDIGSQSTDVIIAADGAIWMRTLPIGGNNFTEALVRAFKLSFSKAEKLKREAGTSKYSRQIFVAMRPIFADLVQELQRSLGYYQSMNRDVEITEVVGVGSTFRLPGLRKFLQQQLQLDVARIEGFKRLNIDGRQEAEFADHATNLATAYGLAVQGLDEAKVNANVLPASIMQQRMWKSKTKWFHAAAALLAIAALLSFVLTYMVSSNYQQQYEQVKRDTRGLTNQAQEQANQVIKLDDPKDRVENFQRLIDYRNVWPMLIEDIDRALANVNSDDALVNPNYTQLAQSPQLSGDNRKNRKRLYIDEIVVRYIPQKAVPINPSPTAPTPVEISQSLQQSMTQSLSADTFWEKAGQPILYPQNNQMKLIPPRYEIQISGSSPYQQTASLLNNAVLNELDNKEGRANRPYVILADQGISLRKKTVTPIANTSTRSRTQTSSRMSSRLSNSRTTASNRTPAATATATAKPSDQLTNPQLAPTFPLADEDQSDDWAFTITFEVELKHPHEARLAASLDPNTPVDDSDDSSEPSSSDENQDAPAADGSQADRSNVDSTQEAQS